MIEFQLQVIQKGGILMYPIMFLSILSLAVFLERMFTLRKEKYAPKLFTQTLYEMLKARKIEDAKEFCSKNKSAIADVSCDILENIDLPITRLMDAAEESGRYNSMRLERYLPTLQAIASISPLLGLLGTVIGMIKTFVIIGNQGVGNAQALAGGISEALITTAAGLSVAIPTMVFYYIVRYRSEQVTMELEQSAGKVINLLFKEEHSEI